MGESAAFVTAPARSETGVEALLRHISGVVDEIERLKAERCAEAMRSARAHLTVAYADKRLQKHRTA